MCAEKHHNHFGHRERRRNFVLEQGAGKLSELDLLEMLLFYAVPRADTVPIAKELLAKFGSLEGVLDAEKGEVSQIKGLKDGAELLFSLLREVLKRYGGVRAEPSLLEPRLMKKYLVDLYKNITTETVYALYFTRDGNFMGKQIVFCGGISSARFSLRTVTEGVIKSGGSSVVLAHNHPSNILVPSGDDIITTNRIATHLAANEIDLLEHYIVGKEDCVGFFAETQL